jgi:hypothetical protein
MTKPTKEPIRLAPVIDITCNWIYQWKKILGVLYKKHSTTHDKLLDASAISFGQEEDSRVPLLNTVNDLLRDIKKLCAASPANQELAAIQVTAQTVWTETRDLAAAIRVAVDHCEMLSDELSKYIQIYRNNQQQPDGTYSSDSGFSGSGFPDPEPSGSDSFPESDRRHGR